MPMLPFGKDVPLTPSEFQREMNRLMERLWHTGLSTGPLDGQEWSPTIDVLEEEDRFIMTAEVPGLESNDIEVAISGESVTIRGHKPDLRREGEERNYLLSERSFGTFLRTIRLPVAVDADRVTASCRKGVLEVTVGKKEEYRPKSIRVDVTD